MAELRKRPRGLQVVWIWSPFGFVRNDEGDWVVWSNWHVYFHRKSMGRPLDVIYRWIAQFGPLQVRMWR